MANELTPATREEKLLAEILGEDYAVIPVTRIEKFLSNILGAEYDLIPATRIEKFLAKIAEEGGGGGGIPGVELVGPGTIVLDGTFSAPNFPVQPEGYTVFAFVQNPNASVQTAIVYCKFKSGGATNYGVIPGANSNTTTASGYYDTTAETYRPNGSNTFGTTTGYSGQEYDVTYYRIKSY